MMALGIDPGSSAFGWSLLRVGGTPQRPMLAHDSCGHTLNNAATVEALLSRLHPGSIVAIESVAGGIYYREGRRAAPAENLFGTASFAGDVGGYARARGFEVVKIPAIQWRRMVIGGGIRKGRTDAAVKLAVQRLVAGWPRVSNAHERDAAGVAIAAVWSSKRRAA